MGHSTGMSELAAREPASPEGAAASCPPYAKPRPALAYGVQDMQRCCNAEVNDMWTKLREACAGDGGEAADG